jgi:hypothetical protein
VVPPCVRVFAEHHLAPNVPFLRPRGLALLPGFAYAVGIYGVYVIGRTAFGSKGGDSGHGHGGHSHDKHNDHGYDKKAGHH